MDPFDLNTIEHDELATELWNEKSSRKSWSGPKQESKPGDIIYVLITIAAVVWAIVSAMD